MNGIELLSRAKSQDEELHIKAKMLQKSSQILGLDNENYKKSPSKEKSSQKKYIIKRKNRGKSETVKNIMGIIKNQDAMIESKNKENEKLNR